MTRRCDITNKVAQVGNNVPKSLHKTRRRFLPNVQRVSFLSDILKRVFSFSATKHGIKTIEHNGGLDSFLLSTDNSKLSPKMIRIKKQLKRTVN